MGIKATFCFVHELKTNFFLFEIWNSNHLSEMKVQLFIVFGILLWASCFAEAADEIKGRSLRLDRLSRPIRRSSLDSSMAVGRPRRDCVRCGCVQCGHPCYSWSWRKCSQATASMAIADRYREAENDPVQRSRRPCRAQLKEK